MNKNRLCSIIICIIGIAVVLCNLGACSKDKASGMPQTRQRTLSPHYRDGTYKARSSIEDDWGGYAELILTVKDGVISECTFLSYEKDGTLKDENYGKQDGVIKNAGLYKIAQNAIKNAALYGQNLVETQDLEKVDSITGATISYKLFQNAAQTVLTQAKAE